MEIEKLKPQEFTPEWVKENLCMDDGNDITDCYSEDTIKHIAWCLKNWEKLDYKNTGKILTRYYLMIKQ